MPCVAALQAGAEVLRDDHKAVFAGDDGGFDVAPAVRRRDREIAAAGKRRGRDCAGSLSASRTTPMRTLRVSSDGVGEEEQHHHWQETKATSSVDGSRKIWYVSCGRWRAGGAG